MSEPAQVVALLLQVALGATLVEGVRRRNVAVAVNALVALCVALLPVFVEVAPQFVLARNVAFGPELPLWLAAAGFLHSLGMLGLYESTWWWDHLTHTVSAALVAALIYAGLVVTRPTTGAGLSPGGIAAATVLFTFAVGVSWELLELVAREVGERYDVEPVLVHYGWRDTAFDLGFDLVGALLVVLLDLRIFVPVVEQFA